MCHVISFVVNWHNTDKKKWLDLKRPFPNDSDLTRGTILCAFFLFSWIHKNVSCLWVNARVSCLCFSGYDIINIPWLSLIALGTPWILQTHICTAAIRTLQAVSHDQLPHHLLRLEIIICVDIGLFTKNNSCWSHYALSKIFFFRFKCCVCNTAIMPVMES